jgi:hypothetical protein
MTKKFLLIGSLISVWFLILGTTSSDDIRIPFSKIEKLVEKRIGEQKFHLNTVKSGNLKSYQLRLFTIDSDDSTLGYVYVNRINSCRAEGCAVDPSNGSSVFEYFDYFFITDYKGEVIFVKVYNYQATHGQQVMSRGWLKQFIGFKGDNSMNYGSDIQAISGATTSAKALITDIQNAEMIIQLVINDSSLVNKE